MKHSMKVFVILISMFILTQVIGLLVLSSYSPIETQTTLANGTIINISSHNLPFGLEPPADSTNSNSFLSFVLAIGIAIAVIFLLMRWKAQLVIKIWFFFVVFLAISVTLFSFFKGFVYGSILALLLSIILTSLKIFRRGFVFHNLTELLIYPGVAALLVPLLSPGSAVLLLILISAYDAYAVWHSGFMQKMAMFQIKSVGIFAGFLVPHFSASKAKNLVKSNKLKKGKLGVAILGGGDVVFPLILAGTILYSFSLVGAIGVILGATLGLTTLLIISQRGKFYPAMPFISGGAFLGLLALAL